MIWPDAVGSIIDKKSRLIGYAEPGTLIVEIDSPEWSTPLKSSQSLIFRRIRELSENRVKCTRMEIRPGRIKEESSSSAAQKLEVKRNPSADAQIEEAAKCIENEKTRSTFLAAYYRYPSQTD
jgi:hypothetical protein